MLSNEFFHASIYQLQRRFWRSYLKPIPPPGALPSIVHLRRTIIGLQREFHWQRHISFLKKHIGNKGNSRPGHDFADKHHPSFPFTIFQAAYIKAKVHLGEINMEWNSKPFYPYIFKHEANKTYIIITLPRVKLSFDRQVRFE